MGKKSEQNSRNTKINIEAFKKWRSMFGADELNYGKRDDVQKKILEFTYDNKTCACRIGSGGNSFMVSCEGVPAKNKNWLDIPVYCTCSKAEKSRSGRTGRGRSRYGYYDYDFFHEPPDIREWYRCNHMAAMFYRWEKLLIDFMGDGEEGEDDEARKRRKAYIEGSKVVLDVESVFQDKEKPAGFLLKFNIRELVKGLCTNRFFVDEYHKLLQDSKEDVRLSAEKWSNHYETIKCSKSYAFGHESCRAQAKMDSGSLEFSCNCQSPKAHNELCEHMLELLCTLWDYADTHPMDDLTDETAKILFKKYLPGSGRTGKVLSDEEKQEPENEPAKAQKKIATLLLTPYIEKLKSGLALSFYLCQTGRYMYPISDLDRLMIEYEREGVFEYGKNNKANFSKYDFAEGSKKWFDLISGLNEKISKFNNDADLFLPKKGVKAHLPIRIPLEGSMLDKVYGLLDADTAFFDRETFGGRDEELHLKAGKGQYRIDIRTFESMAAGQDFAGMSVDIRMPPIYRGEKNFYCIVDGKEKGQRVLALLKKSDLDLLQPILEQSKAEGSLSFEVGLGHLSDFYRKLLPPLLNADLVNFRDNCREKTETLLPPEVSFDFRLDYEDSYLILEAEAVYDENHINLLDPRNDIARDLTEESLIAEHIGRIFPIEEKEEGRYRKKVDNDGFFEFLENSLPTFHELGTVHGTETFLSRRLRGMPKIEMSVSLNSGILKLSISTADLSPEELLELLSAYQKKKRYYLLQNGEFVDFSDHDGVDQVLSMLDDLQVAPIEVIREKAAVPLYRALYLDRMMEERGDVTANRDRAFRALVRNFATIRDTDYEVPSEQERFLRPYQVFGFKWLRVLLEAGFGGILADEMGLGKTIQMITLFQSIKGEKDSDPALVVCPASLVYNWKEEIARFAPGLKTEVLVGHVQQRKEMLSLIGKEEQADVYVTSYDVLKRDIAAYDSIQFEIIVLDEAQYIKNRAAAVTKSVKVLRSKHRFALTGTPIENRLSELWSIFDFLMPGFLYAENEFTEKFDVPITRLQDAAATSRLKSMVSPFILRRLKADVLKDLPAKLEEVRYAYLDDVQRKVYDAQVVKIRKLIGQMGRDGKDRMKVLAELTRIRQICCDPSLLFSDYDGESAKRELCMELIKNALDGGHRVLLFSQFTSMLELLEEDLKKRKIEYYKITGSTPKEERLREAHLFNETAERDLFLVSLKAGGTGLNLTGADMVIHYDPWWNMAAQNQATDRAHRIGQSRQVTVFRLIAKDTIEEKILDLQEKKRDLANAILEGQGESLMSLSQEELMDLLS